MLGRPSRSGVALLLGGVLVLFVGVIAQLAVTDGLAETIWVAVSIVGAVIIAIGIAVLVRHAARHAPPED
ncbi:hypothetical protein [Amnibacterium kyonggiense]|uniref:Uncharacterized protein n=1 Tax=Amnibacterium kyonggiense TaxID=595671 RepID=A0A4R7FEP9_9MICO|nr:hypothetical protein [Amnibacterium kyonggiense]TDS75843.1 hypothetical protein CLV52_2952 [Amnibacterium kyonggiense]